MSKSDKHPLQSIIENTDHADDVRSYEGRGMYGRSCLGVVISCSLGEFFADVMSASLETHQAADAESFRGMRTDSMGLGTVVYFPNVPFVGDDEDEDDNEDDADDQEEECDG